MLEEKQLFTVLSNDDLEQISGGSIQLNMVSTLLTNL